MTGVIFEAYCSAVATAEGRFDELLEDSDGTDGWGPYRRELFWRLYNTEDYNDENIFGLKSKAQLGFFFLTILALSFLGVFSFENLFSIN